MKKNIFPILSLVLILATFQAIAQHPRLLLLEGEEQAIKEQVANSETWAKMHQAILDESENILNEEPLERIQIGRRLLGTSREYLRRIFYLSYAHRMTNDERFAAHAEEHMLKSAAFSDWNPSHFLDVGEMTMALAIGYDWLYAELAEESKQKIREAIVEKGLRPSYIEPDNWFVRAEHNWNQVCNAGMAYGALAVMEDYPKLADSIINRAFESIPLAMVDYGPDGAYPEGYSYWGYGTSFNVLFLSAMDTWYKTDRGLSQKPGFLKSATFLQHMLAVSQIAYNWGDCGSKGSLQPAMFWFAEKNQDPSLLWMEKNFLEVDDYAAFTKNRILPAIMIWGKDIPFEKITAPKDKMWVAQGKNPLALMRTSWNDPNAIYLGFKAGAANVNHGHMDIGSFIMEAEGVRWAIDLGSQNYHSLESKGIQVFGRAQDAQRWSIYRLNNYVHNTLTFNDEFQRVDGYAKIDKHGTNKNFMFAMTDMSTIYDGQIKKAERGVAIKDEAYVVVRDELITTDQTTNMVWNLTTSAEVELTKDGAILSKNGKKLYLKVRGSSPFKMHIWSNQPTTDYDASNPGTIRVGFESALPANTKQTFEVLLIPGKAEVSAEFVNKELVEW
ncbi:MAG: heparinase II/III family protein [Bacteroidota bacterium]